MAQLNVWPAFFLQPRVHTSVLIQGLFTGLTAAGQTPVPVSYDVDLGSFSFPEIFIAIPAPTGTLISYAGGSICSNNDPCGPDQEGTRWVGVYRTSNTSVIDFQTGQLNAETPLPATLPLFATGLGVLAVLGRRRNRKAAATAA